MFIDADTSESDSRPRKRIKRPYAPTPRFRSKPRDLYPGGGPGARFSGLSVQRDFNVHRSAAIRLHGLRQRGRATSH